MKTIPFNSEARACVCPLIFLAVCINKVPSIEIGNRHKSLRDEREKEVARWFHIQKDKVPAEFCMPQCARACEIGPQWTGEVLPGELYFKAGESFADKETETSF